MDPWRCRGTRGSPKAGRHSPQSPQGGHRDGASGSSGSSVVKLSWLDDRTGDGPVGHRRHRLSARAGPTQSGMHPLARLGITIPVVQAPMAGVSTPRLAAAVAEAGALGSISVGATDAAGARGMVAAVRALTTRPFNVNVFAHAAPVRDAAREAAWLARLRPLFQAVGAEPPATLTAPYTAFGEDDATFQVLVDTAPAVVSFHFSLPTT